MFEKKQLLLFISLIGISLLLLCTANYTIEEMTETRDEELMIEPGYLLMKLEYEGKVEVIADLPEHVYLYLLNRRELEDFMSRGEIPEEGYKGRVVAHAISPEALLILNKSGSAVKVYLKIVVYKIVKPYALLALLSYAFSLAAIAMLFITIMRREAEKLRKLEERSVENKVKFSKG
ncbi:MAG: hypothetical protein DRN15_05465 [Thermoprotei archaeon]|nr:MAG: hypothetical protein DRM97_05205 [Thermoprotei archaeon]RLF23631.1 MAG: hypothetical protein DRN15_05465 [Thermoprotei archaeon]